MKRKSLIVKIVSCFLVIILLNHVNGRVNNSVKAEIGGYLASKCVKDKLLPQIGAGAVGGVVGKSAGSVAGAWVGGAIGSFAGPAGAVFGVWAGRAAGGYVGGL